MFYFEYLYTLRRLACHIDNRTIEITSVIPCTNTSSKKMIMNSYSKLYSKQALVNSLGSHLCYQDKPIIISNTIIPFCTCVNYYILPFFVYFLFVLSIFWQWATLHTKPAGGGGLVLDERGEKKIKLAQTLVVDKATGGI